MRGFARVFVLLAGLGLTCGAARADDPPPEPPATYAGKDAAWWVEELRGAGTSRAAYEALKVIGNPAVPAIARALTHHDPTYRQTAVALLREIPGSLAAAKDALGVALASGENPALEQSLLDLAGRLGPAGAALAPLLVARLDSETPNVRGAALAALERTGGAAEVVVPVMKRILKTSNDDSQVGMALRVLQRLGPAAQDAEPEVLEVLDAARGQATQRSRSQQVRLQAITALQRMGAVGPRVRGALVAVVRSNVDGLASHAAHALGEMALREPEAADDLAGLLVSPHVSARRAVLQTLTALRPLPAGVQQRMVALLQDGDSEIAGLAASFLSQTEVDPAVVVPALVAALPQRVPAPRLQEALHQIAQRDPEAFFRAIPKDLPSAPGALVQALAQHAARLARSPVRAEALALMCRWYEQAKTPDDATLQALDALAALAGDGRELFACLRPMLLDEDAVRGDLAARALRRVPAVMPSVLALLEGDARQRRGALRVIALGTGPISPEEDAGLVRLLLGGDEDLRREAAVVLLAPRASARMAVSARPLPEREALLAVFVADLRSADLKRRSHAVGHVGRIGLPSREALTALIALLSDTALEVDCQAVASVLSQVAKSDPEEARSLLLAELPDRDPVRRAGALLALATLGADPEVVLAGLPAALRDGPPAARVRALRAVHVLGEKGAELEPAVRDLVATRDAEVAPEAARTLAAIAPRSNEARAALVQLAQDRTRPWRIHVVSLLAIYGGAAADGLVGLLRDPDVRGQAILTLQHMGAEAHDALPALEAELRRTPNDRALRQAVEALRRP